MLWDRISLVPRFWHNEVTFLLKLYQFYLTNWSWNCDPELVFVFGWSARNFLSTWALFLLSPVKAFGFVCGVYRTPNDVLTHVSLGHGQRVHVFHFVCPNHCVPDVLFHLRNWTHRFSPHTYICRTWQICNMINFIRWHPVRWNAPSLGLIDVMFDTSSPVMEGEIYISLCCVVTFRYIFTAGE